MSWALIEKAREQLAVEKGTIRKDPGGRLRFVLVYPNTYHLGMSSLGFQTVYHLLNSFPQVVCERAFLPDPADLRRFQSSRKPIFSLETQTPLADFDVIGFSVSFELDYLHLAQILELSGIPLRSADRTGLPLVIAGGICPSYNPQPLADLIDALVIGECEELLADLMQVIGSGASRGDLLRRLAELEGVYVPSLYGETYRPDGSVEEIEPEAGFRPRVQRQWVADLDQWPTHSRVLTPDTEFGRMFLIEAGRGCKWGCRFCVADFDCRPPRWRSLHCLLKTIEQGLQLRDTIGLVGATVSDHPAIAEICQGILGRDGKFALSSVRADSLSEHLVEAIAQGGERTLTFAPETGSERLRQSLHKPITDDQLIQVAQWAKKAGIPRIKLYFMIGLPGELPSDIDPIVSLVQAIEREFRPGKIILSTNPFIPKPGTPFQWKGMARPGILRSRLAELKQALARRRGIKLSSESANWSLIQAALSRGDRRLGEVIIQASQAGGSLGAWRAAFRGAGLDPIWYACREIPEEEILPWSVIDSRVSPELLSREKRKAERLLSGP